MVLQSLLLLLQEADLPVAKQGTDDQASTKFLYASRHNRPGTSSNHLASNQFPGCR